MSYSSTFRINGNAEENLAIEWIGEANILSLTLESKDGKRKQGIRIPLDKFSYQDLCMSTSYLDAFIRAMDHPEMMGPCLDEDDGGESIG